MEWECTASGDHKSIAWLIRDYAITVLPSASSLRALRRMARSSAASEPMIGFGNPLLNGNPSDSLDGDYFKKGRCAGAGS